MQHLFVLFFFLILSHSVSARESDSLKICKQMSSYISANMKNGEILKFNDFHGDSLLIDQDMGLFTIFEDKAQDAFQVMAYDRAANQNPELVLRKCVESLSKNPNQTDIFEISTKFTGLITGSVSTDLYSKRPTPPPVNLMRFVERPAFIYSCDEKFQRVSRISLNVLFRLLF